MSVKPVFIGNLQNFCLCLAVLLASGLPGATANIPEFYVPLQGFSGKDVAVIVNDADPLSVRIAGYYQKKRKIPASQIIHIRFNPGVKTLSADQFRPLKKQIDRLTPKHVQALVLTWMVPYRVGCMSITTAFAAGYDEAFCARGCKSTRLNPYFNSESEKPFADYGWRPTMALAGENFQQVKALIDRGVAADFTNPSGSAYLLKTSDKSRSSRAMMFFRTAHRLKGLWDVKYLEQDYIEDKQDVMFYLTGLTHVPEITSNKFLPGAVADHLTSAGGILSGGSQMSALEWIKAGATGSYGAVVEPCNFVQKFPHSGALLYYYIRGNTLIEAYWKSVAWPGQGIFIGEPLARPFAFR